MSAPHVIPALPVPLEPIKGSLGQLRASHDSLTQFLEQLFIDLEHGERNEVASEDLLRRQLEELVADRAGLELELNAARDEITKLSSTAVELASVRAELAEVRGKSGRLRDQLGSALSAEQELRAAVSDGELERRSLEAELDLLRRRSAELADELAQQKRQAVEERSAWNAELKEWRRLFEKQSTLLAGASQGGAPRADTNRRPARSTPAADPVLGSVLAQFESLQQDKQNPAPK